MFVSSKLCAILDLTSDLRNDSGTGLSTSHLSQFRSRFVSTLDMNGELYFPFLFVSYKNKNKMYTTFEKLTFTATFPNLHLPGIPEETAETRHKAYNLGVILPNPKIISDQISN